MENNNDNGYLKLLLDQFSDKFNYNSSETAIILAAGHGKRIKSRTSKMLHKIWEKETVRRVVESCRNSLDNSNVIIVVGINNIDPTIQIPINIIGADLNSRVKFFQFSNVCPTSVPGKETKMTIITNINMATIVPTYIEVFISKLSISTDIHI